LPLDANTPAVDPAKVFEPVAERFVARLRVRIVREPVGEINDAGQARPALLRARGERPRRRTEDFDEVAPVHGPNLEVLSRMR
jgi:hypothetical protein